MIRVPDDVLIHVAKFIPRHRLGDMLNINSTFFHLAMNVRYHTITFADFDDEDGLARIRRLRDPIVSYRVRCLFVNATLTKEFKTRRYGMLPDYADYEEQVKHLHRQTLDEVVQTMGGTVLTLTNITELYINWPQLRSPDTERLLPLFTAAWKAFGSRLRKLRFTGWWKHVEIFPLNIHMRLTYLRVVFDRHITSSPAREESRETATVLAKFIHNTAPTLRKLSVRMYNLDLPLLFRQLGDIPNLERLSILAENFDYVLPSELELTRFLRNHAAALRHIHWSGSLLNKVDWKDKRSKEQRMAEWLCGDDLEQAFSDLLTLELPVATNPAFFAQIVLIIKRSAGTLTSLRLWNRFLSYDEVNTLAGIFLAPPTGCLQSLSIPVNALSPELVLLLARTLPHLKKLRMNIIYVVGPAGDGEEKPRTKEEEFLRAVGDKFYKDELFVPQCACLLALQKNFADALRKMKYDISHWSLKDVGFMVPGGCFDPKMCEKLMWVLAECVPSVEMFLGRAK